MMKKVGCVILILVVCGFLGYQILEARPAAKQSLVATGPATNVKAQLRPEKVENLKAAERINVEDAVDPQILKGSLEADEARAQELLNRMAAGESISPADKDFLTAYLDSHPELTGGDSRLNPLDNQGGPDGANYYYVDNVSPDTATYEWIELRGDPGATWVSAWSSTDDGYSSSRYGLGFSFPFYGVLQDSVRFATNGFIQFTTTSTSLSNAQLPSTNVGGPAIFPYWDDLHLTYGGQTSGNVVAIKNFGNYTVMEYDSIGFCCANGSQLKFEVIVFNDGRIKVQYNTFNVVNSEDSSMTVGIQSNGAAGSPALQYAYNLTGHQPFSGLAIWYYQYVYPHNYGATSISSPSGTYAANTPVTVTARFTNFGTTTESSPVKYSFNGGATITEATGVLAQNAFEDHSFGTQFITPNVGGTYVLTVWSDLATDGVRANDTLRANVVVCAPMAIPFTEGFEGTTGTALPNCWTSAEFGSDNDNRRWAGTSSNPHSPSLRAAYCTYSSTGIIPNDWLYTAPLHLTGGAGYVLDFWYREYLTSSTYYDSIRVDLTTATDGASTVEVIVPTFRAGSTTYQETGATFVPPTTGDYYIAFVYTGSANAGGVVVDDISVTLGGACSAPTVSVADSSGIGSVTMSCIATGGYGGPVEYQWYTGQTCAAGSEIAGANSATYTTTVAGNYSCKAWRFDPVTCAGCDWGAATITPPPPGYDCSVAILLTTADDSAAYNNCGMGNNNPGQSCGNSYNDMVFKMIVPAGNTATIYQYFNDFDSRHSLRWGGDCPGSNVVGCIDDPDYTVYSWFNDTGTSQNVYFVVGYFSTSNVCGNFRLRWTNEVFVPPVGETCASAAILTPPTPGNPTVVSGNLADYMANATDTCDYTSSSPDVYYSLTLTTCHRISMALDDGSPTSGDMHLAVYEAAQCGTVNALLCDDDRSNYDTLWWEDPTQRSSYSLTSFVAAELPAGTYVIRVGHYGSSTSNYRLQVWDNGPCSCDLSCSGGDVVETAENVYDLAFQNVDPDGGCNDVTPVYGTVSPGQTVCGRGFHYINSGDFYRDTDWYQFTLAQDATVSWQVNSEFRSLIGFIGSDCANPVFIANATAPACTLTTVETPLTAGTYNAFVSPAEFFGNPLPSTYRASLSTVGGCNPDTVTNLTVYRALGLSNDVTLRWTADVTFPGTYTVYFNSVMGDFPGTWQVLATGITPAQAQYVDTGTVASNARRFYLVVGVCP